MSHTNSVSLARAYWAIREVYGKDALEKTRGFFKQYGCESNGRIELSQDTPGDGMVSLLYQINLQGRPIQGVLRFAEDGNVYDGIVRSHQTLLPAAARLLIDEAFGPDELKTKPTEKELPFFQGAKEVYECHYQGSGTAAFEAACLLPVRQKFAEMHKAEEEVVRDKNIQKTTNLVTMAYQMLAVAKKKESIWFWNRWDSKDFQDTVMSYSAQINTIPSDTKKRSEERRQKAEEMIKKSLDTYSGARACEELGQCEHEDIASHCPHDGGGMDFYLKSEDGKRIVRREEYGCSSPSHDSSPHGGEGHYNEGGHEHCSHR